MDRQSIHNPYLPKKAVLDFVKDEIDGVKSFYWHFLEEADQQAFSNFLPGQFAQVSVFGTGEFPASLPPSPGEGKLFFSIRQVGSVTAAFHKLRPGSIFGVRGPYGNGFPMDSYTGKDLIFIAGGIGLIPLRSCIKYALEKKDKYRKIQLFYGARTPKDLMFLDELPVWEKQGLEYYLTVDKGDDKWPHAVGVVGALLKKPEVKIDVANSIAFVCGPPVMFRFVIKDLLNLGFDPNNIVSTLERYMKCGLGKCGHCCIGVAYVCVDGPVFTYEQIRKLGEDI